jgi:hypothetical protein
MLFVWKVRCDEEEERKQVGKRKGGEYKGMNGEGEVDGVC